MSLASKQDAVQRVKWSEDSVLSESFEETDQPLGRAFGGDVVIEVTKSLWNRYVAALAVVWGCERLMGEQVARMEKGEFPTAPVPDFAALDTVRKENL